MPCVNAIAILLLGLLAQAEKTGIKIDDLTATPDTTISIQKGKPMKECTVFEIIDGREEVFGGPEYDKSKALASWKTACNEWRGNFKEMNRENRVISVNCGQFTQGRDGEQYLYKSTATYKVRVKMQEPTP